MTISESLNDIAKEIEATGKPKRVRARRLLALFGQERRGKNVTKAIRQLLRRHRLKCEPDFANVHIDSVVWLTLGPKLGRPARASETESEASTQEDDACELDEQESTPETAVDVVELESVDDQSSAAEAAVSGAVEPSSDDESTTSEAAMPAFIPIVISPEEVEPREVVITVRKGIRAGGRIPAMIRRQEEVFRALTQMNDANLPQLVVTNGERGMVEGIFSWQSYGKAMLAGRRSETVADCLSRDFGEVREDKPLFDAVREVIRHGTVVVRAKDGCLCGLITLRDVADTFVDLAEPFLFLGQIENHLRELVERMHLNAEQLRMLTDDRDAERAARAAKVDDFTLGELIRAIQNPEYWSLLGFRHDRAILLERLERVRRIRNKIMHFDADGITPADKLYLKETRRILQEL